jgi:hypothetical protein
MHGRPVVLSWRDVAEASESGRAAQRRDPRVHFMVTDSATALPTVCRPADRAARANSGCAIPPEMQFERVL